MSDIKISVDTTQVTGVDEEVTIIRADGVIDTMTAIELEKVTNSLLAQKRYNIIVDLGGVDYISSAGWGIFISNIREIRLNNGDIKLARMIPNVYEIFELLEFDSILKAFDNIEKAKSDFVHGVVDGVAKADAPAPKPVPVVEKGSGDTAGLGGSGKPSISVTQPQTSFPRMDPINTEKDSEFAIEESSPRKSTPKRKLPPHIRKLDEAIMDLVGKDPFLSVGEIRKAISDEFPGIGFFKTWRTLSRLGLGTKKKRFYFARTRRFSK